MTLCAFSLVGSFYKGERSYASSSRQVRLLALVLVHNHTLLGVGVTSSSVRGKARA